MISRSLIIVQWLHYVMNNEQNWYQKGNWACLDTTKGDMNMIGCPITVDDNNFQNFPNLKKLGPTLHRNI